MTRLPGREIALAIASLLLMLLLLECSARTFADRPQFHSVEYDPVLGHRGIPGYRQDIADARGPFLYELNSLGFRGRELPTGPPPPGSTRLAFFGDSFLVAAAVRSEELVTARVEVGLADRGVAAEVYNVSVIDHGTGQQLLLLDELGASIEPDRIVLALYPGNDLINNSIGLAGRTSQSPGDLLRPYVTPLGEGLHIQHVKPGRAWARGASHLYATLERRLMGADPGWRLLHTTRPAPERLRGGLAPREHLELFRNHDPKSRWEEAWARTFALLRAFRDRCAALHARLLVLVIPTHDQVIRTARSIEMDLEARRYTGRSLDALIDWNLPERRLGAFFEAEDLEARLLLPLLRAAAEQKPDVYARDAHLGPTGHAVASEVVLDWIEGTAAPMQAPTGAPTRRLPDAATLTGPLDFRADDHLDNLGGGWLVWQPQRGGEPWGWWTGPRADLAVPVTGESLIVRGWLPAEARFPVDLQIRGSLSHDARIEAAGAFTLRIGAAASRVTRSEEGYVFLVLEAGETHRQNDAPIGLVLHAIGFENTR